MGTEFDGIAVMISDYRGILLSCRFRIRLDLLKFGARSLATFKRDLLYMQNHLHAPIVYDRAFGAYRFDQNFPCGEEPVKKVLANTVNYAAILTGAPQSLKSRLGQVGPRGSGEPEPNKDLP